MINTEILLVDDHAKSVLAGLPAIINAEETVSVPEGMQIDLRARLNAVYFAADRILIVGRTTDIAKLAAKNASFVTKQTVSTVSEESSAVCSAAQKC